jgi:anaerobic magnesium-protoporphyrin IX monomethyl ester cyclase
LAPWLKYNHDWCSFGSAFLQPRAKAPPNHAAILTSRGCPYDCYFCAVHTVWGRTFRQRSIENVLAEMEELHDDYDVRTFNILDDTFNITKERVLTFCKAVLKRRWKIEIRAASGLRMSNLDIDTLKLMKAAGFKDLYFGIESGCQRVIDEVIRKKIILSEVLNIVDACHQAGIECGGYFMVGVPGESIDEMRHTISFALASGLDKARLYTCQPIPGSRLYEDCIKNGWLCGYTPADSYLFGSEGHIKTGDFSPEDVKVIAEEGKRRLRVAGMLDQKRK